MTLPRNTLLVFTITSSVFLIYEHSVLWNNEVNVQAERSVDSYKFANQNISTSIQNLSVTDLLEHSLYDCGINMGISNTSLVKHQDVFREVIKRARAFLDQIGPVLPLTSMSHLKNPCWEIGKLASNSRSQIICLPYFFIAGFPKSSTSTLHNVLSTHPNIVEPLNKEPHWWIREVYLLFEKGLVEKYIARSFWKYTKYFSAIALTVTETQDEQLITYDGSQSMLWDSGFYVNEQDYCATPAVVSHILPNAKFIVLMRNPATRLYSDFIYSCYRKYNWDIEQWPTALRQGSANLFHNKIVSLINQFLNCTSAASLFECTNMLMFRKPHEDAGGCGVRLNIGIYVVHIKKWLHFFPLKNFLFLRMEDLDQHPKEVLSNITEFLGIERGTEAMSNMLKNHINTHPSGIQPIKSSTLVLLQKFYHPYNEKLVKLLNDSRFIWNDSVSPG